MEQCCLECFKSQVARDFIEKNSTEIGNCSFCFTKNTKVISAIELKDLFVPLLELYGPAEELIYWDHRLGLDGTTPTDSLGELISYDWNIFNEDFELDKLNNLLSEIIYGGMDPVDVSNEQPVDEGWIKSEEGPWETSAEDIWDWFANYIKSSRRYIIPWVDEHEIIRPELWIKQAIEDMNAIRYLSPAEKLYRARLGCSKNREPLPMEDMGAPPPKLARASRANSEGIPVFYAATEAKTSIVEAGRFPGAIVTVREVQPLKQLRLADLITIRAITDPLGLNNLGILFKHNRLLRQLNKELSKPIHPDEENIEYIPTQYLSEAILDAGFDGMCFRSSLNKNGTNIVIFDPEKVRVTNVGNLHKIESVDFRVNQLC